MLCVIDSTKVGGDEDQIKRWTSSLERKTLNKWSQKNTIFFNIGVSSFLLSGLKKTETWCHIPKTMQENFYRFYDLFLHPLLWTGRFL